MRLADLAVAALVGALCLGVAEGSSGSSDKDPYRPGFHPRPAVNWINDPNGPLYHNGHYHLFNQYNPYGVAWGHMSWSHLISSDLIEWQELPVILYPNATYDKGGIFSGSATVVDGVPIITYTGVDPQLQCLAFPDDMEDPELRSWHRYEANPILPAPPQGSKSNGFRDPTTGWLADPSKPAGPGNPWLMAVGSGTGTKGEALLFRSDDGFKTWSYAGHPLHTGVGTMWECPDFYPLPGHPDTHLIKASTFHADYYGLGKWDPASLTFAVDPDVDIGNKLLDYGEFYASKSFYDPVGARQIVWGWARETSGDAPAAGWASLNTFPREVRLAAGGKAVTSYPIGGIASLRGTSAPLPKQAVAGAESMAWPGASGRQLDIEIRITFPGGAPPPAWGPVGVRVLASPGGEEYTEVTLEGLTKLAEREAGKVWLGSVLSRHPVAPTARRALHGTSSSPPGGGGGDDGKTAPLVLFHQGAGESPDESRPDVDACRLSCESHPECVAWTLEGRGPDPLDQPWEGAEEEEAVAAEGGDEEASGGAVSECMLMASVVGTATRNDALSAQATKPKPKPRPKPEGPSVQLVNSLGKSSAKGSSVKVQGGTVPLPSSPASVDLRVLVDRSIVESFAAGGLAVATSRVYPSLASSTGVEVVNHGVATVEVEGTAWPIRSIVPPKPPASAAAASAAEEEEEEAQIKPDRPEGGGRRAGKAAVRHHRRLRFTAGT